MSDPSPTPEGDAGPVLVIGEALIDVVIDADGAMTEHVGGSPANVAMGLAALGHRVDFATSLGHDPRGQVCRGHLESHGVHVRANGADLPTSVAEATLDETGAAAYTFDLHWDPGTVDVTGATHLHVGSIAATLEPGAQEVDAAVSAASRHATVSYDPNIRPSVMGDPEPLRERIEQLIAASDVVKASEDDLEYLYAGQPTGRVMARWAELGAALTIVTLGARGVTFRCTSTGSGATAPALAGDVVDTVGAGDSFMSGLLSGLLDLGLLGGTDGRAALRTATELQVGRAIARGLATSALTVRRAGAHAPTRAEIDTLLT